MKRGAVVLAGALALLVLSCDGTDPRTQVMVTIDAVDSVRSEADTLRIVVRGGPGDAESSWVEQPPLEWTGGEASIAWPVPVALVPEGGDASRRFEVIATALSGATPLVQARVISGYVEGETLWLSITLRDGCFEVRGNEYCGERAEVAPTELPPWTGTVDAGEPADGGEPEDGGADAGMDADVDAGDPCGGCDDGNPCTMDVCTASLECLNLPTSGATCDDGDPCTMGDACEEDVCTGGAPMDCGEGAECVTADGGASCQCAAGYYDCEGACIPDGTCCTNADCTGTGEACPEPGGGCSCSADKPILCDGTCYAECCPGETTTEGCTCGATKTCQGDGTWGACPTVTPECTPGDTQPCCTWEVTCRSDCTWPGCGAVCSPGAEQCVAGKHETCSDGCKWQTDCTSCC